ncbi:MAG: ABC transporter permease [Christensenellales bacterium]|jgi:putative ABC transport system permease protein
MKLGEYVAMASKHIKTNMLRSLLTMLGITIGIGAMIIVISLGDGGQIRINSELQKFGVNRLWIYNAQQKGGVMSTITMNDTEAIKEVMPQHNVTQATYRAGVIKSGTATASVEVAGVDEVLFDIESMTMESGRFINANDVQYARRTMVISAELQEAIGKKMLGEMVTLRNKPYTIVGVLEDSSLTVKSRVYVPLTAMKKQYKVRFVDEISISVKDGDVGEIGLEAIKVLEQRHGGTNNFKQFNLAKEMRLAQQVLTTFRMVIAAIAAISLLVGGIGIMNIMLVTVKERTQEIGIRKALGATDSEIMMQFLYEAIVYSLFGCIFGIAFGLLTTWGFSELIKVPYIITAETIILAAVFAVGVGMVFGILPAKKAAAMHPADALRVD